MLRNARASYQALLEQRTEGGVPLDSVRAFRADVRSQVKAILTPEQLQRWTERFWSGAMDRPEQRRRMRKARRTFRSRAAEVLSTTQIEIIRLHRILVVHHLRKRRAR